MLENLVIQELQIAWSEPTWDKAGHPPTIKVVEGYDGSWKIFANLVSTDDNSSHIMGLHFTARQRSVGACKFNEIFQLGEDNVESLSVLCRKIFGHLSSSRMYFNLIKDHRGGNSSCQSQAYTKTLYQPPGLPWLSSKSKLSVEHMYIDFVLIL